MRILLVDDEVELVSALAERLELRGIEVAWAGSGKDALALAASQDFDLAVLDVKMPGMGGLALKERLAEKHPGLKFIFLTAYGSEQDFNCVASDIGAQFYLVKPVAIEELIAAIKTTLEEDGQGDE
jgi:DNA-binding response OmpR family regulator